jgi:hypothetical protein
MVYHGGRGRDERSAPLKRLFQTDVRFNAAFALLLFLCFVCFVYFPALLLIVLVLATGTTLFMCPLSVGEAIKVICVAILGLGSLVAYSLLDSSMQQRFLPAFTLYVNIAVYGNIGMMVFTPTGGTLRGRACRLACSLLTLWIVQQGWHADWRTVQLEQRTFFYVAVNKLWIAAHAAYRFVLLTLPCASDRNRLLEVYSLGVMFLLSLRFPDRPIEHSFGLADTLVTPTLCIAACLAPILDGKVVCPGNSARWQRRGQAGVDSELPMPVDLMRPGGEMDRFLAAVVYMAALTAASGIVWELLPN